MSIELFANNAVTTVSSGGTTAPAQGTTESWTVASSASFPAASNATLPPTYFYVFDPANQTEVIQVTNVSGTTWSVTRGASGTTPVAHTAGFTVYTDIAAGTLQNFKQTAGAATTAVTVATSTTETILARTDVPAFALVAGVTFQIVAFGTYGNVGATRPTITWRLRWGGSGSVAGAYTATGGVTLAQLLTGTNAPALAATTSAAGASWDVNGDVTLTDTTHAHANLNAWYTGTTLAVTALNATTVNSSASTSSSATPTTLTTPAGPLFLTVQWGTSNASNTITAVAPLIYRAA